MLHPSLTHQAALFFACTLLDYPMNLLQSPFALSFLAVYHSATMLLKLLHKNFDEMQNLLVLTHIWPVWAHVLVASIIISFIISWALSTTLALSAFIELELAIMLLWRVPIHSVIAYGSCCEYYYIMYKINGYQALLLASTTDLYFRCLLLSSIFSIINAHFILLSGALQS